MPDSAEIYETVLFRIEGETLNAQDAGNNFIEDHSIPEIDNATIHIWIENWGIYDPKNSSKINPKNDEAKRWDLELQNLFEKEVPDKMGDGIHYDQIPRIGEKLAREWAQKVYGLIQY